LPNTTDLSYNASSKISGHLSLRTAFAFFITLLSVFPYTKLLPINSITQPYPLIAAIVFTIIFFRHIFKWPIIIKSWVLIWLLLCALFAYMFSLVKSVDFQSLKWLVSYISPLIFFIAYAYLLKTEKVAVKNALILGIIVWFVVGMTQKIYEPSFLTFLVGERSSEASVNLIGTSRGVFGLAHEPTHHAFHVLLMIASLSLIQINRILVVFAAISVLFLAMSSSAVLCIFIAVVFLFFRLSLSGFIVLSFALSFSIFFTLNFFPAESRLVELLSMAVVNPMLIISVDYSVNMRVGGLIASIISTFDNYLLPAGLSHSVWLIDINNYHQKFPWLFEISEEGWPSGYFISLYQLGAFSFPLYLLLYRAYTSAARLHFLTGLLVISALNIFIFQFSLSSPFFGIILAALFNKAGLHAECVSNKYLSLPLKR
jgi:hypothetical protein